MKIKSAQIAAGMDPTGQSDRLPDVRRAQFVAMMRAFHDQSLARSGSARVNADVGGKPLSVKANLGRRT